METFMMMTIDGTVLKAEVPLAATLRQFLTVAGHPLSEAALSDGRRLVSLDLELAHRWRGATLTGKATDAMTLETPALVADSLLIAAERA